MLPNDDLIQNSLCFFHGTTSPEKTSAFFMSQISELAAAVRLKLENDLKLFKEEHLIDEALPAGEERRVEDTSGPSTGVFRVDEQELEKFVAPAYPEAYASGVIINAFTPQSEELLAETIKQFKVDIVIVIDYEMLANKLKGLLRD
jgi:hypothetical protein